MMLKAQQPLPKTQAVFRPSDSMYLLEHYKSFLE